MSGSAKRILMLTHEFAPAHGGIARYATELATAAAAMGHQVSVLAPDYNCDQSSHDSQLPFQVKRYSAANYSPKELPSLFLRASRIETSGFDFIHAVDPSFVMALAFARRFRRISYEATVYGTDILGLRTSVQATMTGTRRMFEYPTRLIAISRFTKDLLLDSCPRIPGDRVAISPLGVNPDWFATPSADISVEQLMPGIRKHLLLTVSRLDSRKGHRSMLRGLARISDDLKKQITYGIVGTASDASYLAELQTLAISSGCDIRFLGNLSDQQIRRLYASASLFCMPGEPHPEKVEGFGLVYLEAAAQGLPSLASRVGAVPEVVLHDQTGWLVEPSDPSAIADALTVLLRNEHKRTSLGQSALQNAKQFTWDRSARITYGDAA